MTNKKIFMQALGLVVIVLMATACQKLKRPALDPNFPKDPDPPAYNPLKSYWAFEDNLNDGGENDLSGTGSNLSYVAGISGKAIKVGSGGYFVVPTLGELTTHPNGFIGVPSDTLSALGSFTVSFWMNGDGSATGGPIGDGAQGIFAIAKSDQFWGNLEIFLENYTDASDATAAWIKIHMFNSKISGGGEQWIANDDTKIKNVLKKWTHIALTYNAGTSTVTLYKDGAATAVNNLVLNSGNYGDLNFDKFNGMAIGTFAFQTSPSLTNHGPESWARSFNGALDNVRIYNQALTSAEISDLYTNKK